AQEAVFALLTRDAKGVIDRDARANRHLLFALGNKLVHSIIDFGDEARAQEIAARVKRDLPQLFPWFVGPEALVPKSRLEEDWMREIRSKLDDCFKERLDLYEDAPENIVLYALNAASRGMEQFGRAAAQNAGHLETSGETKSSDQMRE